MNLTCIILAAGKGTRMKSDKAKVLHEVCFKPLLDYTLKLARKKLSCKKTIAVIGHQKERILKRFSDYEDVVFAIQDEQLGTGHAVMCAVDKLDDDDVDILIVCGDSPLVRHDTIRLLYQKHSEEGATISILTAVADDPTGYGRIVKGEDGTFLKIVEEKDADKDTKKINDINTGTYIVKKGFLVDSLKKLKNENTQEEYYLTDITSIAVEEKEKVVTLTTDDFSEAIGINTKEDLAYVSSIKQLAINTKLMSDGVTIIDPHAAYISEDALIGCDTVIYPGVTITGNTTIHQNSAIHNGCIITDCKIGANVTIFPYSVLEGCVIEDNTKVGPFARLRPGTTIKAGAKIGNFVEIKKSSIGEGSKAGHLTYIGDATIGKDVNIGAGTITCNYDGEQKHETVIEDFSFIGSNTSIVAPVTIKRGALVGAGAVITKDVPEDTIAVERSPQKHYPKSSRKKK